MSRDGGRGPGRRPCTSTWCRWQGRDRRRRRMLVQLMRRFRMLMWLSKVDASQVRVISLKCRSLRVVAPPQRRRFAGSGGRAWLRKLLRSAWLRCLTRVVAPPQRRRFAGGRAPCAHNSYIATLQHAHEKMRGKAGEIRGCESESDILPHMSND